MTPTSESALLEAMILNGQHVAVRLLNSQKLSPSSPYLGGEEPPTPRQVGAVLHALADHTLLTHMESEVVLRIGDDRAHLGAGWRRTTALGRFLQEMGRWLGA